MICFILIFIEKLTSSP